MKKQITGKVVYQNLGMGFWGIVGNDGNEWLPINMPEQLKNEGAKVTVVIKTIDDHMSMHMWGTAVKIISFQTLMVE